MACAIVVPVCLMGLCAGASSAATFVPLGNTGLVKGVSGAELATDIAIAGYRAGRFAAFFGVDKSSTAATQYLASGLRWRFSDGHLPMLQVSARRTEARGVLDSDEFEIRFQSRFDPGNAWFMPTLAAAFEHRQVFDASSAEGSTLSFGVTEQLGPGRFGLRLFRTDAAGVPLISGSPFASRGIALDTELRWLDSLQLSSRTVVRKPVTNAGTSSFGQHLALAGPLGLIGESGHWQLQARYGTALCEKGGELRPLDLDLKLADILLADWHLTTIIGWHRNSGVGAYALPVSGAMGRFRMERVLELDGITARFMPTMAFGRSALAGRDWAVRAGMSLQFTRARNSLGLSMAYVSSDWNTADAGPGVTAMLQFTHAGVFRLASL